MTAPALGLQAAIYAALTADPPIGAGVYDAPPPAEPYPWIEIGQVSEYAWRAAAFAGERHEVTIHAWSRYRGDAEVKALAWSVRQRLDEVALDVMTASGGAATLIQLQWRATDIFADADPLVRHAVMRFEALMVAQ